MAVATAVGSVLLAACSSGTPTPSAAKSSTTTSLATPVTAPGSSVATQIQAIINTAQTVPSNAGTPAGLRLEAAQLNKVARELGSVNFPANAKATGAAMVEATRNLATSLDTLAAATGAATATADRSKVQTANAGVSTAYSQLKAALGIQ